MCQEKCNNNNCVQKPRIILGNFHVVLAKINEKR